MRQRRVTRLPKPISRNMFCNNCNTELKEGQKFCTNCGAETKVPLVGAMKPSTAMPANAKPVPWTFSKIAGTVALVVVVGVLLLWQLVSVADIGSVSKNNDGLASFEAGNNRQAVNELQEASQSAVSNEAKINSLKNLAFVYSSDGQNELALESFQQALNLTSEGSFDYYLIAGEITLLQGNSNSALLNYNKAYQLRPDDFQINNSLAIFYMDTEGAHPEYENYPKALVHAQVAYDASKLEVTKQNLALAHYWNGNYDQAISLFSSLNIDKETYTAFWTGLAYLGKKDVANAKYYLKIAIAGGVAEAQTVYDSIE